MLVLARKKLEQIELTDLRTGASLGVIAVVDPRHGHVRLGIDLPSWIGISRSDMKLGQFHRAMQTAELGKAG